MIYFIKKKSSLYIFCWNKKNSTDHTKAIQMISMFMLETKSVALTFFFFFFNEQNILFH